MIGNKKLFYSLTPLSHKDYVTFEDDKKGKVLGTGVVKVFEHFWIIAMRLNNEHLNCLKAIHGDNETEFRNASLDQFCLKHGVDQQFSASRVPQ
jgi:hypothetical protein